MPSNSLDVYFQGDIKRSLRSILLGKKHAQENGAGMSDDYLRGCADTVEEVAAALGIEVQDARNLLRGQ